MRTNRYFAPLPSAGAIRTKRIALLLAEGIAMGTIVLVIWESALALSSRLGCMLP